MNKNLFLSMYAVRLLLVIFGFIYYIYVSGGSYFKTKYYFLGCFLILITIPIIGLSVHAFDPYKIIFWTGMCIFGFGSCMLFYIFINWKISLNPKSSLSLSEINCFCHMIVLAIFLSIMLINGFASEECSIQFCIIITCAEGCVALLLIVVENRSSKFEMLLMKDVCIYCYHFI
jgi:hypothetical protein